MSKFEYDKGYRENFQKEGGGEEYVESVCIYLKPFEYTC